MRIELTDDPAAFRTRDWSDVVAADPAGTLFHTPAYLKLWWEEFGSGALLLAAVLDGDRTMGADGLAPRVQLPAVAEAYLRGLPAKLRHEIRRKARRLAEESGGYRVRWSTPQTVAADLDRFVELHQSSPGPKGRFMHAGMEIFF